MIGSSCVRVIALCLAATLPALVLPRIATAHLCHTECLRGGARCHNHGGAPWCIEAECTCDEKSLSQEEWEKRNPKPSGPAKATGTPGTDRSAEESQR
jgi:hypothetical protein